MALTDYDIQRISSAVVENLVNNDRFMQRMARLMPRKNRLLNSRQAADMLGITRKTVCEIAEQIGGERAANNSSHWMFEEEGLIDRYRKYKESRK